MPQQASENTESDVREHVRIFDTTLRDGEQSPGFSMNRAQKLRMAGALDELGVDVLEAGFPQASPDDFAAVAAIAETARNTSVCGLARCQSGDIEAAARALQKARSPRIHLFLSTSPLHREFKLRKSRDEVVNMAGEAVRKASRLCDDVEFSAEDGTRTEREFLVEVFNVAVAAGARTLNVPDTVGYTTPAEITALFRYLRQHVEGADKVVFSAHCHDDLGMAVANSLAAVEGGARQVECTINGIGERAGNAALEEVAMAMHVRGADLGVQCGLDTRRLYPASRLLTQITGQAVPRNKAVVGANAFAHESGIHQHGMLRHRGTYEIMRAQDVGMPETKLVLGKHSGRAALRQRLEELGHAPDGEDMDALFERFKKLADRKREIHDGDLETLALGRDPEQTGPWRIEHLHTTSQLDGCASASVTLQHADGHKASEAAIGDGPVDAVLRAFERAAGQNLKLEDFRLESVSEGGDAQGRVTVDVRHGGRRWRGQGVNTDIVGASAEAALEVVNAIASTMPAAAPAQDPVREATA